ncbi:ABC transporter ATP-binding protein [Cellulomonas timonensis]|uniref:ABC transporter ATP-binding protein n=1 Tax=Cellulomonas timonensis TaxID=1689271 RepID=UPI00082FA063|nr:ABC transporter ATP-binding protein [Cellulomonas timonensis]
MSAGVVAPRAGTPPEAAGEPLLDVAGLTAGYGGTPVLHDVALRVPAGDVVAVVGANGAGKTTLLRALSGLVRPRAGTVRLGGADLLAVPVEHRVRAGLAHVPEGHGVIAELTVDENLRLGGLWRGGGRDLRDAVDEVYALFEPLARRVASPGHQLSGGERQMLAVGRALVSRPRLLLLDEPSLGLAPRVVADIMAMLRRLCDDHGLTILLVEQNVRSALSVADVGVVLHLGQVVATRPARSLLHDDALRHAYLGF